MGYLEATEADFERVDISAWPRADHFRFFSGYQDPFFTITAEVVCERLLSRCEELGRSKTFSLWHGILRAANEVEQFRFRLHDDDPVLYKAVHLSPTVLRDDGTFTISFVPYREALDEFCAVAREVVEEAKSTRGFSLDNETRRVDLVHFSTVPWFRFTGVVNARASNRPQSEPKIVIGKYGRGGGGKLSIPISITAHHGFVDGYHVARYLTRLEELWS